MPMRQPPLRDVAPTFCLIISGPLVEAPDREVQAMVNVADLFELFGEIAGVAVRDAVPKSHLIDSMPMLAYLTNPNQPGIRQVNYTQTGNNIHLNDQPNPPCVLQLTSTPTCVQIFNSQGVQSSTRNDHFKLVQRQVPDCSAPQPKPDTTVTELYTINEDVPIPQIDKEGDSLCSSAGCPSGLTPGQLQNFTTLSAALVNIESSEVPCPGDGNEDKEVNGKDILDWQVFASQTNPMSPGYSSSWYDFNHDGQTDSSDLATILQNLGKTCKRE